MSTKRHFSHFYSVKRSDSVLLTHPVVKIVEMSKMVDIFKMVEMVEIIEMVNMVD